MKPCSRACGDEYPPDLEKEKENLDCGWCVEEGRIELEAVLDNLFCQLLVENAVINEVAYEEDACCGRRELCHFEKHELRSYREKKSMMQG